MSKRKPLPDPKTVLSMALGGYFRIYRSDMVPSGRYIMVRNGEAGHCEFHTDPSELKKLGEFLIAMSEKSDDNIDTENGD